MAVVQGVKEKVHLPIYDSLNVEPEKQLRDAENSSTLKFFVNVQGKTKLETNLQSAGLLPHYNTFEARALRVVFSDLPPRFPDDPTADAEDQEVANPDGKHIDSAGVLEGATGYSAANEVSANISEFALSRIMELLQDARDSSDQTVDVQLDDDDRMTIALRANNADLTPTQETLVLNQGGAITFSVKDLISVIKDDIKDDKDQPPDEQINPNNGAGTLVGKLIYNTVTTLYVGEKIMISMPTWFFPSGAG